MKDKSKKRKKIIIIISIIAVVLIAISAPFVYGIALWYDLTKVRTIEIPLDSITAEEKAQIIEYDFMELEEYPESIEFISLKYQLEFRESQYFITFFVDKEDEYLLSGDRRWLDSDITKITDYGPKAIYEFNTNFTQHSKEEKWYYLNELISKYKT